MAMPKHEETFILDEKMTSQLHYTFFRSQEIKKIEKEIRLFKDIFIKHVKTINKIVIEMINIVDDTMNSIKNTR